MDQQQADAYIRLVGHLTQCTKEEAVSLLQKQKQLVDANLLLCLLQMERAIKIQGRSDIAEYLRYLSCNLPMLMGREIVAIEENYVYLLLDLLQADNSIDCYPEIFHSILTKNLDKLNSQFVSIFKIWLSEVINLNSVQATALLSIIQNFSTCIQGFPYGNPKLNLEIAFAGYDILLNVWHQDTDPNQWAKTQLNKGITYAYLAELSIDAVPHLENAIKCFQLASEIFKQQGNDENWALSQNYLGSIHRSLAESSSIEDALQNLKQALKYCRTSRKIFKQIGNDTKWALAQKNLGNIHSGLMPFKSDLISFKSGNKIHFAKKTIKIYISASNIYKRQGGAEDLAMTMNGIGLIYSDLAHFCKKKSPQLNKAIKFFLAASEIYSQIDKARWANVQNHLGNAYSDLAKLGGEDKSQNLEKSITSYRQALEIFKPNLFPSLCLQTGKNLGDLAFKEQLWEIAIEGYDLAITAVETSRVLCDDKIRREKIHGRGYKIYANVIQSCINLHQYDKALEYVERSRSKHLYDLITNQDN
jgi:tetratricopeptide (TPR) repeat protein